MGWKISGSTVILTVAIVAGFLLVRQELRERLIATLQNPENYADSLPRKRPISL